MDARLFFLQAGRRLLGDVRKRLVEQGIKDADVLNVVDWALVDLSETRMRLEEGWHPVLSWPAEQDGGVER